MPLAALLALKPSGWLGAAPPAALEQILVLSLLCLLDPWAAWQPLSRSLSSGLWSQRLLVSSKPREVLGQAPWDPLRGGWLLWKGHSPSSLLPSAFSWVIF